MQHSDAPGKLSKPLPNQQMTVWQDGTGKPYLVRQQASGEVNFTPLENALANFQQPVTPTSSKAATHDPIAIALIAGGAFLLIAFGAYLLGFFAGQSGRQIVTVPTAPRCDTRRSSFLFWSQETKECQ